MDFVESENDETLFGGELDWVAEDVAGAVDKVGFDEIADFESEGRPGFRVRFGYVHDSNIRAG